MLYNDQITRPQFPRPEGISGVFYEADDEDRQRAAANIVKQMLRNGLLQTTRERGRYRIIAAEMEAA